MSAIEFRGRHDVSAPFLPTKEVVVTVAKPFQPAPVDDAYHPDLNPGFFEWWYFDAVFDNKWSCAASFQIPGLNAGSSVDFSVYDPDGKKSNVRSLAPASAVSASTKTCDVRMGANWAKGEHPQWDIHVQEGDSGCDLTFRSLTQGVIPPAGGGNFSSEELPHRYLHWTVCQPRAEVTGELRLGGRTMPVRGVGYHDHDWGVGGAEPREGLGMLDGLIALYDFWYWGKLYLPDYTLVYSVGRGSEGLHYRPLNVLFTLKGDTLLARSDAVTYEERDMATDPGTGCTYARELIITPEDPKTNGIMTLKLKEVVESASFFVPGHGYLRFLYDCHAILDFDGHKVEVDDLGIHELMKP